MRARLRSGSCGTGAASPSPTCTSRKNRYRAPLSLLWLALLTVAAGPAACFVMPGSARVGCCGFFAAASPMPRVVLEPQGQVSCSVECARAKSGGAQRALYARMWGRRSSDRDGAGSGSGGSGGSGGINPCVDRVTSSRGADKLAAGGESGLCRHRVAQAPVFGRGLRVAATALRASVTGVDMEGRISPAEGRPKRILILMSDTGGGHRASSQALAAALKKLYGDQVHTEIVDIWTDYGRFPFADAVRTYKFLGRHPVLWKMSYDMARFPLTRRWAEVVANLTCHRSFRRCLDKYQPDLIISTHPLCHHVPHRVLRRLRRDTGKHIPFATVVTDLGSAHPTWFDPRGDLVYVPSDVLRRRAQARGIPPEKLMQYGLPVRDAFWEDKVEKKAAQKKLGLKAGVRTALIVGGGDGVGRLHEIATNVADKLASDQRQGQVVVVCGTNKKTKEALDQHPWPAEGSGVSVRVLGFVGNMDEWMSAADLLVTKAGPGTIAEACTKGLPVVLSSFLPGQEAGNVPYVTDNGFGLYRRDPEEIGHEVSDLLADPERLERMGANARVMGRPRASIDIARSLVSTMLPGTKEIGTSAPSSSSLTA